MSPPLTLSSLVGVPYQRRSLPNPPTYRSEGVSEPGSLTVEVLFSESFTMGFSFGRTLFYRRVWVLSPWKSQLLPSLPHETKYLPQLR